MALHPSGINMGFITLLANVKRIQAKVRSLVRPAAPQARPVVEAAPPWFGHYGKRVQDHAAVADQSQPRMLAHLLDIMQVKSVVDIGCGMGQWSRAVSRAGIADIVSCDLDDQPVEKRNLPATFVPIDLREPLDLGRRFDLVICAEVAEHVPADAADNVVAAVCAHGDVAIFGAATPLQGGKGHVNEQWPNYWVRRFAEHDFVVFDIFRPTFWNDRQVRFYYRQNTFLFVHKDAVGPFVDAGYEPLETIDAQVHPEMMLKLALAKSHDGEGVLEGLLDQLYEDS